MPISGGLKMSDTRYKRQQKLDLNVKQSVTIVGCGGIGAWVAIFAAMSGIEDIILFDPDILESHNLNRLPFPEKWIGRNKAIITQKYIESLRQDINVKAFHFILQEFAFTETDWLIDCTDDYKAQKFNQGLAGKFNKTKYMKVGYDGLHVSIHNRVAEWGEETEGYTVVPSWVVPAATIAALAVAKIIKYSNKEVSCNVQDLFVIR